MKMTSRFALVAAAGILIGAAAAPAKAADLGGGCCADLEERVAELEATTARKGNRVVSLQVYGQVNKAILFWDDGEDSDAYIVDNDASGSRVGFKGEASIKPGWTAGFNIEFDYQDAASDLVDNHDVFDDPADEIKIRMNNLYVESEQLGRITLGQQSSAADGAAEVVLGNSLSNASLYQGNDFRIVGVNTVDDYVSSFDGGRNDLIRYDSPSIYGFIVSASWGDDDYYDVALRFKKEWNSIRIAAAIAYQNIEDDNNFDTDDEVEIINGSISVMHVPTGIYGAFAAGESETEDDNFEETFWYAQLGIEKKFLSYGSTTLYGEYGLYEDLEGEGTEAERWGFGIVQKIDSAAMEIYAQFLSIDVEDDANSENPDGEYQHVLVGSRIKF